MRKVLLIFISILFVSQFTEAQKRDTLVYFMGKHGVVLQKDSAQYFLLIMSRDKATKLYPVAELYPNGKQKMTATSKTDKFDELKFEGAMINFFRNGHVKSNYSYQDGNVIGVVTTFYPNGKIYTIEKGQYLVECRDSTGKVLAANGNGTWIKFDDEFRHATEVGPVKDSLENGKWDELVNDSIKFKTEYTNGDVISSTNPHTLLGSNIYTVVDQEPEFSKKLYGSYGRFLQKNLHYPKEALESGTGGKVILQFVVEKDGTLTNFKVIQDPDKYLTAEALRVLKLSPPWVPGKKYGADVRTLFTIPVNFTLTNDN